GRDERLRGIVLGEELHVRAHVPVHLRQRLHVGQHDDEHACISVLDGVLSQERVEPPHLAALPRRTEALDREHRNESHRNGRAGYRAAWRRSARNAASSMSSTLRTLMWRTYCAL